MVLLNGSVLPPSKNVVNRKKPFNRTTVTLVSMVCGWNAFGPVPSGFCSGPASGPPELHEAVVIDGFDQWCFLGDSENAGRNPCYDV